ncbi:MAG: nucleotide sugar dehydrogenase [Planctomycetota bacterium]|nr:nucleotide sugar dehydrogenase [Planctomycetota bacterium]
MSRDEEICVIGLGYVGLPTAGMLATSGFRVLGVDVDRAVVDGINSGSTRLEEAGLAAFVSAAVKSGNLTASVRPEAADAFIICVPTPISKDKGADLSAVRDAARAVAGCIRRGNLVVLESTSPVGTTRNIVGRIIEETTGLAPGRDFDLCYCPERVLPGNTIAELVNNDRIVGGFTRKSAERAAAIYGRFCQGKISLTDDMTAEMCKLMENTFRDVNVALANVFARMAEEAGIDVWDAIELANRHPRVKILRPGPGTGGHCISVDPWFLVEAFPEHAGLVRIAREVNDSQPERLLKRMMATGKLVAGDKLAILGAAYKADVDDPRESPAVRMAEAAGCAGIRFAVHDPHVRPGEHHGLRVSGDLAECIEGAAAAVLMTDHKAYEALTPGLLAGHMRGRLIGDARNWLDRRAFEAAGFTVILIGSGAGGH